MNRRNGEGSVSSLATAVTSTRSVARETAEANNRSSSFITAARSPSSVTSPPRATSTKSLNVLVR